MARLPDCVKQQIIALRQAGRSWKQICTQLDVKQSTAWNSVAKWKATGSVNNKAPNGRPRKITPRAERKVSMCIHHNQRASLSEIIASYNVDLPFRDRVCSRTVQRALHRLGYRGHLAAKKLNIASKNRLIRRLWCRQRLPDTLRYWSRIVLTDEVRIGFGSDGGVRI
jgi:transposase